MNLWSIILTAAAGVTLLGGCGERQAATPFPASRVVALSEQFTGDFALIDKNGLPVSDEDFEGKIMMVYFGFTNCPDVCPGDVGAMSAALNELGPDASEIAPVFISVDPERDTPEALGDYFAFDDRIIALTGSLEAAAAARLGFKVYAQKQPAPESALEYTVGHQQAFFFTNRAGQPEYAIIGGASPQEIAVVLRRSIGKS